MNQLDTYYRALLDYRKLTSANSECRSFSDAVRTANAKDDSIVVIRNICHIDEDWVDAIEAGLVYIEKAIAEERQFIRSNGEVVPIEKVKHITKESVEHLAKHSNLITKEQEGDEIIPDQLYNVERLNDYTVYENRFLYMLLRYLEDFISLRYNNILDLSNQYDGRLTISKEIAHGRRKLSFSVDMRERRADDKYLRDHNPSAAVIDRISLILKAVMSYLSTPLMEFAAKAPMLKPPITKTNVLKMDKHFKRAVELYDYIIAYDKPGYTVEEKTIELSPFKDDLSAEMSEICALASFLTYEYGLDMKSELKTAYEQEEQKAREEKIKQKAEQLESLRKRMKSSQLDTEEYILALEKQLKLLESESARVEPLLREIGEQRRAMSELESDMNDLRSERDKLEDELGGIEERHAQRISELYSEHDRQLKSQQAQFEDEKVAITVELNSKMDAIRADLAGARVAFEEEKAKMQNQADEKQKECDALSDQLSQSREEALEAMARLRALRAERGISDGGEDFSSKEDFDRLERELAAFIRFYDKQWGSAKKKIRKDLLNLKNLKG